MGPHRRSARGLAPVRLGAVLLSTTLVAGGHVEGETLAGVDWAERELADITLKGCVIEDAAFGSTVLQGARFERCRLVRCRFSHADLRESVFEDCHFSDTAAKAGPSFAFCRLDEARFARCVMAHARFEGCDLYGLALEDCNLMAARLTRSTFGRIFGRKLERISARITGCNLELAELAGVRLEGAELAGSRLREADLSGADLTGADLTAADLFQAILDGAKLDRADLRGAELSGLDLRRLASFKDIRITPDQQFPLLDAMGVDVVVE